MSIASSKQLTISLAGTQEHASPNANNDDAASSSSRPLHPPSSPQPDFSLTTKVTFDDYVEGLSNGKAALISRPASASASHHLKLEIPPSNSYPQPRQRQHRTHTRNRRPMSAPSSRRPAASKATNYSAARKDHPPARPVSAATARRVAAAFEPKTVAFQSTTARRPAPRPKSSPIYLSSTHTSQRTLGHKIHAQEIESRSSWQKKKITAAPPIASRVKAADRLRKAQQYDKALAEVRSEAKRSLEERRGAKQSVEEQCDETYTPHRSRLPLP